MKLKKALKRTFYIVLNLFLGWFSFWIFTYAYVAITDRKDADSDFLAPIGIFAFFFGIIGFIGTKIALIIVKKNKKEYLFCNIIPYVVALVAMVIYAVIYEYYY